MNEIPQRVTLREDCSYIWSAAPDMETERQGYKFGGKICEGAALAVFLGGIIAAVLAGRAAPFLWCGGFAVVILLVTFGVVRGMENWPGERRLTYRMYDTGLATGYGRKTAFFEYKKTKIMIVGDRFVELRAAIGAFRVYFSEEDAGFVKGYIRSRIPREAEIREQQL